MKPICKLFLSAAALFASAACSNDLDDSGFSGADGHTMTIKVLASASDNDSRVVIGDKDSETNKYPVTWEAEGETLALGEFIDGTLNQTAESTGYELNDSHSQATFSFDINTDDKGGKYLYHALSPASALDEFDAGGVYFTLPTVQKPRDNGGSGEYKADPAAMILYSCDAKANAYETRPENLKLKFQHLAAYSCLTIKGLNNDGAAVRSVTVTANDDVKLSGLSRYDGSEYTGDVNSVTLDVSGLSITEDTFSLWFTTLPAAISASDGFTVTVTAGDKVFTRKVTPGDMNGKDLTLQAGHVSRYTVNMQNASSKGLFEGDYMIVASNTDGTAFYALSSEEASGTRLSSSEKYDELPASPENLTYVWHIEMNDGNYNITNEYVAGNNKYLTWPGSANSDNMASLGSEPYALAISYAEGSDTQVNIKLVNNTSKILARNNIENNKYFAFYNNSGYKDLYLVPVDVDNVPVITVTAEDITVGIDGESGSFEANVENAETVTVESEAEWITDLSYTEGSITYKVAKNEGYAREGYIVITATGSTGMQVTKTVLVKQDGQNPYVGKWLIVAVKDANRNQLLNKLYSNGGLQSAKYDDNRSLDFSTTIMANDDDVIWTITKNTDGTYYICDKDGNYITCTVSATSSSTNNGSISLQPYPFKINRVNDNQPTPVYIQPSINENYYFSKNSSSAFFRFYTNKNQHAELYLVPAVYDENAPVYKPAVDKIEIPATGDENEITVESKNVDDNHVQPEIMYDNSGDDWLEVYAGANAITYKAEPNSGAERTATITVTAKNDNSEAVATATIKVTQAAAGGSEPEADFESDDIFVCTNNSNTNPSGLGESTFNGKKATGFKLGTQNNVGSFTSQKVGITGDATLTLYGVAWNGKTASLKVSVDNGGSVDGTAQYSLRADNGASGTTYKVEVTDADKYTFNLKGLNANSTITFTSVKGTDCRVVVAGVHLIADDNTEGGGAETPDPEEPETPSGSRTTTFIFSEIFSDITSTKNIQDEQITQDGVSLVFAKGNNSTATQYFANGTSVRWYGGAKCTISGKTITKIVITYTETTSNAISADTGSYSLSAKVGTWTGSATAVTLTQGGTSNHYKISTIEVTYE